MCLLWVPFEKSICYAITWSLREGDDASLFQSNTQLCLFNEHKIKGIGRVHAKIFNFFYFDIML